MTLQSYSFFGTWAIAQTLTEYKVRGRARGYEFRTKVVEKFSKLMEIFLRLMT